MMAPDGPSRLVVRLPNWLGDAVMAVPSLIAVRHAFPHAYLALAGEPSVLPIFEEESAIQPQQLIPIDKATASSTLREGRFDTILLLTNSFRTAWVARQSAIAARWGYATGARGPLLTKAVRRPREGVHQSEYYLRLVQGLGIDGSPKGLRYTSAVDGSPEGLRYTNVDDGSPEGLSYTNADDGSLEGPRYANADDGSPERPRYTNAVDGSPKGLRYTTADDGSPEGLRNTERGDLDGVAQPFRAASRTPPQLVITELTRTRAARLLEPHGLTPGTALVGFAPGAAYGHAKRWPPDRVARVIDRLARERGVRSLLVGAAGDREAGRAIESSLPSDIGVVNLIGRTDLRLLMGVIDACRAFVSNDSGAMHLAAALGVPVTAIFGPTNERATAPLGDHDVILKPVFCRPCMLRECPIDHRCMKRIGEEDVYGAVTARMDRHA